MEMVIDFLQSIRRLSPELELHLRRILRIKKVKKNELLLRPNEVSNKVYFIASGLFRVFRRLEAGDKEINNWFQTKGGVMFGVKGFLTNSVTGEGIEALKDSEVWYITNAQMEELMEKYPEFTAIYCILNKGYRVEELNNTAIKETPLASQRYEKFKKAYHHLIDDIPDKQIAYFLNIDATTFSKLKNNR